jgi:hypothetical protein
VYRRIPKKKSTLEEEIEGKDVEKDLKGAKNRADRLATIMEGLKANCGYLQETFREELFNELAGDQNQELRKRIGGRGSGLRKSCSWQCAGLMSQIAWVT